MDHFAATVVYARAFEILIERCEYYIVAYEPVVREKEHKNIRKSLKQHKRQLS